MPAASFMRLRYHFWLSLARHILLVCGLGMVFASQAWAQCVKTVRWSDDAPYSFKLPNGEVSGFSPT